jgi:hypothetical protein
MVRSLVDFKPDYDYSGNIILPSTPTTFFIVGTVNLGAHSLYAGNGNAKHHFMGFPDSQLVSDVHVLASSAVNSSQSFKFTSLQLKTTLLAPEQGVIYMESGGLDIENCTIDAPAGIQYIGSVIPTTESEWPISIKSTEFTSQVRSPARPPLKPCYTDPGPRQCLSCWRRGTFLTSRPWWPYQYHRPRASARDDIGINMT